MKNIITLLLFCLLPLMASADSDVHKLSLYLQSMNKIEAEFVQHTFDGKGTLLQTQKGQMQLKKPNKFRWESVEPYAQLLLSNGETLWQYDEDLEQVSIQPLDIRLSSTPALLLAGSEKGIASEYDVYAEKLANEHHFVLIPKRTDALFDRLRLEFDENKLLMRMVIKDEVGQKTIIRLYNIVQQKHMSDSLFNFIIPAGIDVIRSE